MARLYSDLLDGTGRRYYFGLTSAPGGITNASPATLTLAGRLVAVQELNEVFRTPATAALSLIGYAIQSEARLQPATSSLGYEGKASSLLTLQVITNALPPDYTELPDNAPTILFIATVTPDPATLTVASLVHNITQGGNILVIEAGLASLTLTGWDANLPRTGEVGSLTINGLAATLWTELVVTPTTGQLTADGGVAVLSLPFTWVDDDPPPSMTWLDDPPP